MGSQLGPDIEQRIRALCDEIAVAHDLDEELREELRGHIEDKVLGYLSGDEPVSEADAVILAREHFGDRARLKELLSDVHRAEATGALWRRIAAGYIFGYGMWLAYAVFGNAVMAIDAVTTKLLTTYPFVLRLFGAALLSSYFGILWRILAHSRARLETGTALWFMRWSPWTLGLSAFALMLTRPLFELVANVLRMYGVLPLMTSTHSHGEALPVILLIFSLVVLWILGISILWMWWCDSPPRRVGVLRTGTGAFALVIFLDLLSQNRFRLVMEGPSSGHALFSAGEARVVWMPFGTGEILTLGIALLGAIVVALVGLGAYRFALWAGRRSHAQFQGS